MQGARKLFVAVVTAVLVTSLVHWTFPEPLPEPPPPPPLPDSAAELLIMAREGDSLAREKLLTADRSETVAAVQAQLCKPDYDHQPFYNQLLTEFAPEEARSLVRAMIDQEGCFIPREAWQAVFTDDELKEMALTLPSTWAHAAYELVRKPDPAFIRQFIANPANQWGHVLEYDVGVANALENYDVLTPGARLLVIDIMGRRSPMGADPDGLLAKETDPCIIQEILYQQQRTDELMASLDANGGCQGNMFWRNWDWEKKAAADYPDSFLARGVRAWEAIMGEPYFSDSRFYTQHYRFPIYDGAAITYNPDREIPAWQDFLSRYSKHPAADEAAYRVARSYEIKGDYVQALRWLDNASQLPDGSFKRQAMGRITWILDALLTDEQLAALDPADLPEELAPQVAYARALRLLRAGRYAEALSALDQLLAQYGQQQAGMMDGVGAQTWSYLLRHQRPQVARLVELAPRTDAEGRYALAALMFHDDYLFRNQLFFFGVGPGFIGGHAWPALQGDYEGQYGVWAGDQNNYVQAYRAFGRITDGPEEILAKAAYSRALSLAMLPGPGSYIDLWRSEREIGEEAATLFAAMANRFPTSNLADDALLSVAYLRQDPAYFDRIVAEYPDSDMAADARLRSFEGSTGMPVGAVPFRYLREGEAPPDVEKWVAEHLGAPFEGTLDAGGYTYILVLRPPGETPYIFLGADGPNLMVRRQYGRTQPNQGPSQALIRIRTQSRPIVFGS